MTIDYNVRSKRYLLDGQPVTKAAALERLRTEGLTTAEAQTVLRVHWLCATIEARLPAAAERLSLKGMSRCIAKGFTEVLSIRAARRWVREHLRPARSRHPRGVYSWKHQFEHDERYYYIRAGVFAQVLIDAGFKVIGDHVYCKEIDP